LDVVLGNKHDICLSYSEIIIYTRTIHRTTQLLIGKSVGRAQSLRVIPCHLPYNWGKSTEKHQSGKPKNASWHNENRLYRTWHT